MELPLFAHNSRTETDSTQAPWADRLRPKSWEEFVGQEKVRRSLMELIAGGRLPHCIFFGPPGSGKTSLARLLRSTVKGRWIDAHGADLGAQQMRQISAEAKGHRNITGEATYLLVDEIHRLNKAQQDHLLEPLELGTFTLVATTTENPYFVLSRAFLSRVRVFELEGLDEESARSLLERSVKAMTPGREVEEVLESEAVERLLRDSAGDARKLISQLEALSALFQIRGKVLSLADYLELQGEGRQKALSTDHYHEVLSGFIKSIRGSDPDAALLWLAHLIRGGVDPRTVARRLVISASEDIGNADPRALSVAVAAAQAVEMVGLPEAGINLAQAVVYLCCSPKSDASYAAYQRALRFVDEKGLQAVPRHLTRRGSADYRSPHQTARGFYDQRYKPESADGVEIFIPGAHGFEKKLAEYLGWLREGTRPSEPSQASKAGESKERSES